MLKSYVVSVTISCITFPNFVTSQPCGKLARQLNNQGNQGPVQPLNVEVPPNELPPEPTERPRNRCCPYDFDSRICNIVDDRVLCGFNRNLGRPVSNDNEVSLGENCRLKGGRLECGYVNGPFTNPRRPPPFYNPDPDVIDDDHDSPNDLAPGAPDKESSGEWLEETDRQRLKQPSGSVPESNNKQKMTVKKVTPVPHVRGVTRCVEIRDRIVCRDM